MAPNVEFHFFPANDLNGDVLHVITDEDAYFKSCKLTVKADGLGDGELIVARKVGFAGFGSGTFGTEVFVRVLVHAYSSTEYFWGFFLSERTQDLIHIDEDGGEEFHFKGPGPKFYLDRAALRAHQYVGEGWAIDLDAGVFRWSESAPAGRILNKLLAEDAAAPFAALPDLTNDFDNTDDSNGDPWTTDLAGNGSFELPIGQSFLKDLWELEDSSDLRTSIYLGNVTTPEFRLSAWNSMGEDVTGTDPGAGVCILREGLNVTNDALTVQGKSLKKASHVIVQGKDSIWEMVPRPSWDSGEYVKIAKISYPASSDRDVLNRVGVRWLRRQDQGEKEIAVEILPGNAPDDGYYFPAPDGVLWVANTITLDTAEDGSTHTPLDFTNDPNEVTGIELELLNASRTDTALEKARSWKVTVQLNYDRGNGAGSSSGSVNQETTGSGECKCRVPHPPPECDPGDESALPDEAISADWRGGADPMRVDPKVGGAPGIPWGTGQQGPAADGITHTNVQGSGTASQWFSVTAGSRVVVSVGHAGIISAPVTGDGIGIKFDDPLDAAVHWGGPIYSGRCGAGDPLHPLIWSYFSYTFDVPAGATYANVRLSWKSCVQYLFAGTEVTPIECPPDSIPPGTGGDSPYYARSDDPRFDADDQHLITKLSQRVVNNSGDELGPGDVVIPDITFDGQGVTTTTTASLTDARVGVVETGGADGEDMVVIWEGAIELVVNDGAATSADGDYLYTSTTAGAAAVSGTRTTGAVGRIIRDDSGDPVYVLWWGVPDSGGGSGAPTTADYLVGTAQGGLSAEIVVGTTPGGELGGTWASPTVDATHSGSTHAAATSAAHPLNTGDPHTQYRLEADDHSHASAGAQGGTVAHSVLTGVTANQHHTEDHASRHADGGADQVNITGLDGFPGGTTDFLRADGSFVPPPGTAAGGWNQILNESGASFANWTAIAGTWASDGTKFTQSNLGVADHFAYYSASKIDFAEILAECEIQFPTTGQTAPLNLAGIVVGCDGAAATNNTGEVRFSRDGTAANSLFSASITGVGIRRSFTVTINLDTWYKLRVHYAFGRVACWMDGTLLGSAGNYAPTLAAADYFGLNSFRSLAWFRNIKLWTPTLPA